MRAGIKILACTDPLPMLSEHILCRMQIPLRWGDMDAAGHVNNTVYFRLAEEVRLMWFTRMGLTEDLGRGQGPVIVNATMTFCKQLHYPSTVRVVMMGTNPGRSSFDSHYVLMDPHKPDWIYAHGSARCVWIDYAASKSHPMPQRLRDAILHPKPMMLDI